MASFSHLNDNQLPHQRRRVGPADDLSEFRHMPSGSQRHQKAANSGTVVGDHAYWAGYHAGLAAAMQKATTPNDYGNPQYDPFEDVGFLQQNAGPSLLVPASEATSSQSLEPDLYDLRNLSQPQSRSSGLPYNDHSIFERNLLPGFVGPLVYNDPNLAQRTPMANSFPYPDQHWPQALHSSLQTVPSALLGSDWAGGASAADTWPSFSGNQPDDQARGDPYVFQETTELTAPGASTMIPDLVGATGRTWETMASSEGRFLSNPSNQGTHEPGTALTVSREGTMTTPMVDTPFEAIAQRFVPPKPSSTSLSTTKRKQKGAIVTKWRAFGNHRSRFDAKRKAETAATRQDGACENCRKMKVRCTPLDIPYLPCGKCAKKSMDLWKTPCCRVDIIDVKLFRLGSAAKPDIMIRWTIAKDRTSGTLLLEDGTRQYEPPRTVRLAQEVDMPGFAVTVSRFEPDETDATAYTWIDADGVKRQYILPPYYISDMDQARRSICEYCHRAGKSYPGYLLKNSHPMARKTFQEAQRFCNTTKSTLVEDALMFWSATRMIERFWYICEPGDLLGMKPMEHDTGPVRRHPSRNAIPVTPIMDTQIDELVIASLLMPLVKQVLAQLKRKTLEKKRENWYEIYLATFVVLHNSERVLHHVVDYARRFSMNTEPRSNQEGSLSHAYYHACKTILSYFHFASGGAAPLSVDWLNKVQDSSIMDDHQRAYLSDVQAEVLAQEIELKALQQQSMYDGEMYWCHQMLFPGWKAEMPHRGRFLEFTEADFLVT